MKPHKVALVLPLLLALAPLVACSNAPPPEAPLVADPPLTDGPPGPTVGEAKSGLARGVGLLKAEKFDEARAEFEASIKRAPSADAWFYLAVTKEHANDRAGAEAGYKEALKLDANHVDAASNLAALYLDDPGRVDEAIAILKPIAAKSPDSPQVYANLGYALGLKHDVDGATKMYERALAKSSDPDTELAFGSMLVENHRAEAAGPHVKKAYAGLKTADVAKLATIGRLLGATHAFAECVAAFDKVLATKKDVAELWVRRGTCRHQVGDEAGALLDYTKGTQVEPSYAAAHFYLGQSLILQKQSLPGVRELEKAEKLGKGTPIERLAAEAKKKAFKSK